MFKNYICALDIGSNKISASVASIKNKEVGEIFFASAPSKGVKRGSIVDPVELTVSVGGLLRVLKEKSGLRIKQLLVNISGEDIRVKHSRAILPLAERGNKIITLSDIQKVNDQARILGSCLEEDIIHLMPFNYAIDSKADILNPLGLYSHRLEVDLFLVCAKMSSLQSLGRVINQAGYEVKKICFSGLATCKAVFGKEINEGINVLCDIGSDVTELLVFKDGLLKDIKILYLGGSDLTDGIAKELKIPFELAEEVKKSHSSVGDSSSIQDDREILIKKDNLYKPIKQKLVAEILTSNVKLISQAIKDTVEKTVSCNQVNSFVVTGRTVLEDGFLETLEGVLDIPVRLGRVMNPSLSPLVNNADDMVGQKYVTYLTSLGMICDSLPGLDARVFTLSRPSKNIFIKTARRMKEMYLEYF